MTAPETIGTARMLEDRTLVLDLRAESEAGGGAVGMGQLRYPPTHPQYAAILAHVGPMEPGQSRPVPPWRD